MHHFLHFLKSIFVQTERIKPMKVRVDSNRMTRLKNWVFHVEPHFLDCLETQKKLIFVLFLCFFLIGNFNIAFCAGHEDTPGFIDFFARELLPTEETGSGSTSTVEIPHPDPSSPPFTDPSPSGPGPSPSGLPPKTTWKVPIPKDPRSFPSLLKKKPNDRNCAERFLQEEKRKFKELFYKEAKKITDDVREPYWEKAGDFVIQEKRDQKAGFWLKDAVRKMKEKGKGSDVFLSLLQEAKNRHNENTKGLFFTKESLLKSVDSLKASFSSSRKGK